MPAAQPGAALPLPDKPSIAVLPFQNMSGDPEQEYFADGMVEDIITALSRIRWFFVIARNSTFTYKGRAVDVKQVGRELGVRYVLEGSVRKAGNRVRITAQLIEAETGNHVWAERYDRDLADIFAVQDEITERVVAAIEPELYAAEQVRSQSKPPDSLDAYDLVLRAQPDVFSRMPERAAKALLLLERALAFDPAYALAHAYAAECHHIMFLRGGLNDERKLASIRHAEAAIAHGQDDALALAFAGFVLGVDKRDLAAAFAALEAGDCRQSFLRHQLHLRQRSLCFYRAARARHGMGRPRRCGSAPSIHLRCLRLRRDVDQPLPVRPIRGSGSGQPQGRPVRPRLQLLLCDAGGAAGKARPDRRGEVGSSKRLGVATRISMQPSCRDGHSASAPRRPQRRAPRRRAAAIAS